MSARESKGCATDLKPFDGDVAVRGGDDDAAIERRALAADAEEDGGIAPLLPKRCVHVERLVPAHGREEVVGSGEKLQRALRQTRRRQACAGRRARRGASERR